jgi:elongation factor Ts
MSNITAALVKELRTKSGAGMMDCKKALSETDGDLEAAMDWLRKKGIASAEKKSSRVAADGLVAVATSGNKGALVELNAETDFVARNEQFQTFLGQLTQHVLENGADDLANQAFQGKTVAECVTDMIATIGENMSVRRAEVVTANNGVVASYVHSPVAPNMGKIGVLVAMEGSDTEKLSALGKQVAMHVAATKPESLTVADLDQSKLDRERQVLVDQARASGKPEEIIEKMVEGRLRKYYEEVVLNEQVFVIDGENKVGKVAEAAGGTISSYTCYTLGEGIEKKDENFAEEVAAALAS